MELTQQSQQFATAVAYVGFGVDGHNDVVKVSVVRPDEGGCLVAA